MSRPCCFPELWSSQDERDLHQFEAAIAANNLAGGLFAIEGTDPKTVALGLDQLDTWAALVRARLTPPADPETQREALHAVLGRELGLRGDREDYYHPRNSFLGEVLRRRRGLPIMVSCVWILVGQRAKIDVQGVGLPGHFLVQVGGQQGVLADPFEGGIARKASCCQRIVEHLSQGSLGWRDSFLDVIDTRSLLERVLRNLICAYERGKDSQSLYRCVRFMASLCAGNSEAHLLHAHLSEALGDVYTARAVYQQICEQFAGTEAAQMSTLRLASLCKHSRLLN